jgi:hypothetical protein
MSNNLSNLVMVLLSLIIIILASGFFFVEEVTKIFNKYRGLEADIALAAESEDMVLVEELEVVDSVEEVVEGPTVVPIGDVAIITPPPVEDLVIEKVLFEYVEVIDSCGPHFEGECLRIRSGPGKEYPTVASVRNGVVLKIDGKIEFHDQTWYKIVFDEWLRYPDRVSGEWYVAADFVKVVLDEGERTTKDYEHLGTSTSNKRILVDRSDQTLMAYEGEELFLSASVSTGLALTPTPRGNFTIYKRPRVVICRVLYRVSPMINITTYQECRGIFILLVTGLSYTVLIGTRISVPSIPMVV